MSAQADHYYSNDIAMPAGYAPQDTIGFLRQDSDSGAVALKRYYNNATGRHYYSATTDQPSGYSDDGIIGYLDTSSGTGLTALYRHYNSNSGDYLLSVSSTPPSGYTLQATLGYMQNGNPSSGNNLVAYIRNPIGQVVQGKTQDVTYSYNYDNAHRVASVTDSRGNKQLSYFYSNAGLLLMMRDSDGNSVFASLRISNHKFQMANYSLYIRLRQFGIWNSKSEIAQRASYAYDPLGNRSSKTAASSTLAYVYDAANQLTEIRQTSITGTLLGGLVYDNNGNLTKKCESGTVTVSSSNCSGTTVTDLTHDTFNRLAQVAKTSISTESYKYDDQGNRIQKTVGSTITNFLYNGPDVIGQYTSTWGTASAILTHGPGMDDPIIRATSTTTQYFHQDGLGSVVSVTNQSGTTDGTARYDAWGNKIASTGTIPQYGYTGREPDDTGLVYYRARFYDPSIGRFTQRDPIGFNGGINLYAYVKGNPINFNDPMGLVASSPTNSVNVGSNGEVTFNEASYASTTPQGQTAGYQSMGAMQNAANVDGDPAFTAGQLAQGETQVGQLPSLTQPTANNPSFLQQVGEVATKVGSGALDLIGKVWNAPNTLIGLAWGGIGLLGGAEVSIGNNGIQFTNHPLMSGAITIGNTISYASGFGPNYALPNGTVGGHESSHTIQGQILGPLYLPSNILGGIAGLSINGSWHGPANWNEIGPQSSPPTPWPW